MVRVLLVGESWVSISTHYKGFNNFVSGVYETGLEWFSRAMKQHSITFTHMPAHIAANEFPFKASELDYDTIILSARAQTSQSGANSRHYKQSCSLWSHC
jgi:uncharacterized membrane protein